MSQYTAKPKSSTSEASEQQTTRRTIKRCASDEDDDTPFTKSTRIKKTTTAKKQLQQDSSDNDDSDDSDAQESDDEVQNTSKKSMKKPVPATKKRPWNMRVDSEDDDDEAVNLTSKKPRSKSKTETPAPSTINKSTAAKQKVKPSHNDDSESGQEELESDEENSGDSNDEQDPKITIAEFKGDMFTAPPKALLLHACNCLGSWNKGIAYTFQKLYPDHYSRYYAHCRDNDPKDLIGTCLIIPPQKTGKQHWFGRGKDKKDEILKNTENAVEHMVDQLEGWQKEGKATMPKVVWLPKINSGLFRVPWAETKKVIEDITYKGGLHINVVDKK
ncbi:hypothetical protein E4T39_06802 [Aureobasidium subglaciale]|nr:hypothetical protein E4T39_06802 [Aureobasidium subglaciale]